ncbi:MAG TPA: SNF2-related protein [Bacteroidales bacterium]|nr:SNF2-related protein [Bacteroidales bacterium]
MAKYSIGQRVSLISYSGKRGRIESYVSSEGGYDYYEVLWDDYSLEVISDSLIKPEVKINTPWDLIANNEFFDYRDFSIATTFHKIRNTTSNTISSLKASRTIFKPYQYKPLVKFLKSDLRRVLIADEVGLGKTIEAGHIMLELAARGDLKNVLVICTKSLMDKWKTELQDKFNFILKKYDRVIDLVQDIKDDVARSRQSILGIINYEKVRNPEILRVIEENNYHFDLLICDEAHKIRNSETQQHKGVDKIVKNSGAVTFLTATPIMTDMRNLHNLVRVLDHEGYDTWDIFNNAIALNRPFIHALSRLNNRESYEEIAEELHNSDVVQEMTADEEVYQRTERTIAELFENDPLYQRARVNLLDGNDKVEIRAQIQQDLVELNSLNHIYSRTRKKEVMNDRDIITRDPKTISVELSNIERQIYDGVINQYDDERNLGLIQRKRQMASCIVAFQTPRTALERGVYDRDLPDAKYEAFKTIIDEIVINKKRKIIVFAFFTNTLLYLKNKLQESRIQCEIIYGSISDRTERIDKFQHNEEIRVLLSSEVGSEGIDLQFCDTVVNYDLPWNPMVVEQRIGRIDRIGQENKIIHIYNLIITDTIEERIYERLYQRINLFKESIGDLDEILGENEPLGDIISKGIESLYKTRLTEEEQLFELDRLGTAIESERLTMRRIRTELEGSFANDIHFQNEIESIEKNNRYLTKEEIIKYIESIIRIKLSSLRLIHLNEQISELELPNSEKNLLFNFIEQYKDDPVKNPELENLYRNFRAKFTGNRKIQMTFDQQYAYQYKMLEYVSAFHPLINAITNFFEKEGFYQNRAHKILLQAKPFSNGNILKPGFYVMAIYKINIRKHFSEIRTSQFFYLRSVLADINGSDVVLFDKETSEYIFGHAQLNCGMFLSEVRSDQEFIDTIRPSINSAIIKDVKQTLEDEEVKFLSSLNRRTDQEVNYIDSRITRMNRLLSEGKGIEAIIKSDIENLTQKKEELLRNKSYAKVEAENNLMSVNLLEIV